MVPPDARTYLRRTAAAAAVALLGSACHRPSGRAPSPLRADDAALRREAPGGDARPAYARDLRAVAGAIDRGDLETARRLLSRARARHPRSRALAMWAAGLADTPPAPPAAADGPPPSATPLLPGTSAPRLVVVDSPPWDRRLFVPVPGAPLASRPRLRRVASRRNRITDVRPWFTRNGLTWPKRVWPRAPHELENEMSPPPSPPPPAFVPDRLSGLRRSFVIEQETAFVALFERPTSLPPKPARFGEKPRYGQILAIYDRGGRVLHVLDFKAFRLSPATSNDDLGVAQQDLFWAHYEPNVVFVAHGHWTYARASGGQTGYVTAVNPETGEIYWRSRPRVANARNFLAMGPYLVTGYGFTSEPDHLFVLRKIDGEVMAKVSVRSAPEYILPKGDRIFVRTYDRDEEYRLEVPKASAALPP